MALISFLLLAVFIKAYKVCTLAQNIIYTPFVGLSFLQYEDDNGSVKNM